MSPSTLCLCFGSRRSNSRLSALGDGPDGQKYVRRRQKYPIVFPKMLARTPKTSQFLCLTEKTTRGHSLPWTGLAPLGMLSPDRLNAYRRGLRGIILARNRHDINILHMRLHQNDAKKNNQSYPNTITKPATQAFGAAESLRGLASSEQEAKFLERENRTLLV